MKKVMLAILMMVPLAHSTIASAQIEDKVVCEANCQWYYGHTNFKSEPELVYAESNDVVEAFEAIKNKCQQISEKAQAEGKRPRSLFAFGTSNPSTIQSSCYLVKSLPTNEHR